MEANTEKLEYFRPAALSGVEVLVAERSARQWRVFHENYVICSIFDASGGACEWKYRGNVHRARAGDLMLMEPGEVHANTEVIPPSDFRVVFIKPEVIEQASRELRVKCSRMHLRLANVTDEALFHAFARLHNSLARDSSVLEQQSKFATCLRLLIEGCAERPPAPAAPEATRPMLERARAFIQAHFAENIALEKLAEVSGLSRFHLGRDFAGRYGLPPHSYQVALRLGRARSLLAMGTPAAETAVQVGFSDQSHLIRHFKNALGVTPGFYANPAATRTTLSHPAQM